MKQTTNTKTEMKTQVNTASERQGEYACPRDGGKERERERKQSGERVRERETESEKRHINSR